MNNNTCFYCGISNKSLSVDWEGDIVCDYCKLYSSKLPYTFDLLYDVKQFHHLKTYYSDLKQELKSFEDSLTLHNIKKEELL